MFTTLAPRDEFEGYAFRSVCKYVRARNSKNIAPIDLGFFTQEVLSPRLRPPLR